MTMPAAPPRAYLRALAVAAFLLALAAPARADTPEAGNFDARTAEPAGSAAPAGEAARERLRDRLGRFGALTLDETTGTLRAVSRLDGYLTAPSTRSGAAVALGYVREHAAAFGLDGDDLDGLRLTDRETADRVEHLTWEQRYGGIPVADAGLEAAVTTAGQLVAVTGPPAADLAVRSLDPALSAPAAYAAARRGVGASPAGVGVASAAPGGAQATRFDDGGKASLALYRGDNGYRLAWRVLAPVSSTGVYDLLIDARTGATVRRANRVSFVNAKVFRYSPRSAAQVDQSFDSWLTSATALTGPNAHAFADLHDVVPFRPGSSTYNLAPEAGSDVLPSGTGNYDYALTTVPHHALDGCPGTPATPLPPPNTSCTWDPRAETETGSGAFSWAGNRRQSVTQLFYLVNAFHDHLRNDPNIAFDAGGFRRNPGRPVGDPNGAADPANSDPVIAQAYDGADTGTGDSAGFPDPDHRNNANFLTLPDGQPGLMQMYLWQPTPGGLFGGYDGANDASVVFHEYAHGLSNRLVTDAAGFGALNSAQAGALGEGLSDYYAMDYLVGQNLQTDGSTPDVRFGVYLDNGVTGGLRYQPLDCEPLPADATAPSQCPDRGTTDPAAKRLGGFTFADFGHVDSGPEVHGDGEIWAQTLWSIRRALITAHAADGVGRARRYITEGLRLAPPEPSFLDLRNAILAASVAGGDEDLLWTVFAKRGMGYFAGTADSADVAPVADFTDPASLSGTGTLTGTVRDEDGQAVAGASVGIAGLDSGVGPAHVATTGQSGAYAIGQIPTNGTHPFPVVRARKAGYAEDRELSVTVPVNGSTTVPFTIPRDWSSPVNAAAVGDFTGPDNTSSGCGPGGLVDDDPGTVWGTTRQDAGQRITVALGAPVDIAQVEIDPSAGCGDDQSAALGSYEVLGATARGGPYTPLAAGALRRGRPRRAAVRLQRQPAGGALPPAARQDAAERRRRDGGRDVRRRRRAARRQGARLAARRGRRHRGGAGRRHRRRHADRRRRALWRSGAGDLRVRHHDGLWRVGRRREHARRRGGRGPAQRRGGRPAARHDLPLPRRRAARRPALRGRRRHVHHRRLAGADAHPRGHAQPSDGDLRHARGQAAQGVAQGHDQGPRALRREGAVRHRAADRAQRQAPAGSGHPRRPPRPHGDQDPAAQRARPQGDPPRTRAQGDARAQAPGRQEGQEDRQAHPPEALSRVRRRRRPRGARR